MLQLLADENLPFPTVDQLRRYGYDVVTLLDMNLAGRSIPDRSLNLLRDAIRLSNRAYIFDNSGTSRIWIAEVTNGSEIEI